MELRASNWRAIVRKSELQSRDCHYRVAVVAPFCLAYSFLTHETLIDIAWDASIKPMLLSRYPNATPEELRDARAFAYGGSTIQDAGYYPFGHPQFSDLTHYVRTGDFITNSFVNRKTSTSWPLRWGVVALCG